MWPFSKKWKAPTPRLAMVVSLSSTELPSPILLANPGGVQGAVAGMLGPADAKPDGENMLRPLKSGPYFALSPGGGCFTLQVEQNTEGTDGGLQLPPEMLPAAGLTPEMLEKFNRPAWRVIIELQQSGKDIKEAVDFATQLARRLAAVGDGIVMDTSAYRFFGATGWPVDDPLEGFDVRAHVNIHMETGSGDDPRWFHTHGMLKFGCPEMEIYDVPSEFDNAAYMMLLDIAQYVVTTAMIEPGQTCGDPNQPFYAREGTKNREGHWEDLSVIELVDLDERQKPVVSGAPRALQHLVASSES